MIYLIANWKSEQSSYDIKEWITIFRNVLSQNEKVKNAINAKTLSIIICPPYPFISYISEQLEGTGIHIGSQDISSKEPGKYTGEVTAAVLKGLIDHAIIGHSERRTHFQETDKIIGEKVTQCVSQEISPILCIRGTMDVLHVGAEIIAYEPVSAIGSGHNEKPSEVVEMKQHLALPENSAFLYGGSVSKVNILAYAATGEIDGYLVGTTSLDPDHFMALADLLIQ